MMNNRILIVDDHPSNIEMMEAILNKFGYKDRIECVFSGEECIEFCKKEQFACIFMDLRMPGLNGFQTSSWIRNNENPNKETPIIAITTERDCLTDCVRSGMQTVIYKPIDLKIIQKKLREYDV